MGRRRSTRSSWTAAWAFMAERYFEPAEVERLIPTLTRLMAGVMRANEEATTIAGRLEAERERIGLRSEEHTSELQSQSNLVCRLLLEKKNKRDKHHHQMK